MVSVPRHQFTIVAKGWNMRELDGMHVVEPGDGADMSGPHSRSRELISAELTDGRWSLGEVIAEPNEGVQTHLHPGEPEALIILEGNLEMHGANGVTWLSPGDVVFVPADTEHGLRTPEGGRWMSVWPTRPRVPGPRYAK